MPLAIIAGIPRFTVVKPNSTYTYVPPQEWQTTWIHAEHTQPDLAKCWQSLSARLDDFEISPEPSAIHILAFHKSDETRNRFIERIQPYHRLRFLETKKLALYGTQTFATYLDDVLGQELNWHNKVRPDHHSNPLILPEMYFTPIRNLARIWAMARTANSDRDTEIVAEQIRGFRRTHKDRAAKPNCYEDDAGFRFKYNVEPHGLPTQMRENWKYAFRLPDKMQYDVELSEGEGAFSLGSLKFKTHANISPHGFVIGRP